MGSPAIIRLYCYYIYFNHFNNHNHIGVATWRAGGLQPPCKRSNRAVGNSNKRGTQNNSQQVVYDEFMKQIRTVRHSFNTTSIANHRVQLAVPPSTNYNHNHNNNVFKKVLKTSTLKN